jgi:hypothetical protein
VRLCSVRSVATVCWVSSQVRSTKIICNRPTNRSICCKQDTCGPDQLFKATDLSKYCRIWVFSFLSYSKESSLQTPTGWRLMWQSRDTRLWGKTSFFMLKKTVHNYRCLKPSKPSGHYMYHQV